MTQSPYLETVKYLYFQWEGSQVLHSFKCIAYGNNYYPNFKHLSIYEHFLVRAQNVRF